MVLKTRNVAPGVVCLALFVAPDALHASTISFVDHLAKTGEPVRRPPLKIRSKEERQFATMLRGAMHDPVNFAGHFVLTTWGCGAGCVMGGAINVVTGAVTMLPFTVSDWPLDVTEPLSWRRDSTLLVVTGSLNETGHGKYFYDFDGKAFHLLQTEPMTQKP
ncbi:MAG: hypothetical protein ABF876_07970 [Acetobacter aceti]|uniref:Uncharacterized protein n=1 Tax=Acetobacter aceti TaxID=435 RepID=A0A1U9KGP0_ACEAC|nr:hypothetical protein [Acetobacter aceti]AQS84899.1 hypothetical protein A0U92_09060 [Acetobacter aceti]